jgi:hypothetical protein
MLIKVKAKPKAKEEYVKRLGEDFYEVAVKEATNPLTHKSFKAKI